MSKKLDFALIKRLREETGAPVIRVQKVLAELDGNEKKALEVLKKEGFEKAAERGDRATSQGVIASYVHHNKKVAALAELLCETDFVARNEMFQKLAEGIAMQVASMNPKDVEELTNQEFIKDTSKKIGDLVKEVIAKTGENIRIGSIQRVELGK